MDMNNEEISKLAYIKYQTSPALEYLSKYRKELAFNMDSAIIIVNELEKICHYFNIYKSPRIIAITSIRLISQYSKKDLIQISGVAGHSISRSINEILTQHRNNKHIELSLNNISNEIHKNRFKRNEK